MPVTEALMRPGFGSVVLLPDTPGAITKQITDLIEGAGCHIVITKVPMDPSLGDAAMLGGALCPPQRVVARPSRTQIDFTGPSSWLDTYLETAIEKTAGTPSQWLTDLVINGLSVGTVTGGSNVTFKLPAYGQTRRNGLDLIAEMGGWEYDVQSDFTVDAGAYTNLFESPPKVVITNRAEGDDGTYTGLLGSIPGPNIDASNAATKVVAVGQGDGQTVAFGSDTHSIALKDQAGNTPTLVQVINAPTQTAAGAGTVATNILPAFDNTTRTITVTTGEQRGPSGTFSPAAPGGSNLGGGSGGGPRFSARSAALPGFPGGGSGTKPGRGPKGEIVAGDPRGGTSIGSGGGPSFNWLGSPSTGFKGRADSVAQMALGRTGNRRGFSQQTSESQFVRSKLRPGDEVYVYDLEAGILDTANQITYRGETISPAKVRCTLMTWPLERGLGVYVRSNAATPTYIDLTPFVQWEAPGTQIDVSDWTPASYGAANRSNPLVETRVKGAAGPWSTITLASANWTIVNTPEWSTSGDMVRLRGLITRTTSIFAAGTALFTTGSGNPPSPTSSTVATGPSRIIAATPDAQILVWIIGSGNFTSYAQNHAVAVGDSVWLDGVFYLA